ncbi:metalloregulator ArsR/SmtB family transcription factor [Nocardioides hungaricus]
MQVGTRHQRPPRPHRHRRLTSANAERLAEVMQGLASPLRLRILEMLRAGPATVTEICDEFDVSQASVSNHLRLMRHLGLVTGHRDGRHVHYSLFDEHVAELLDEAIGHIEHLPGGSSDPQP